MWGFTNPRMDVARKLWSLHNAGCKVDVTLNRGRASRTIMRQLLVKSSRYGQMVVEDAWKDKNRNDYGEQYTHHKAIIINGRAGQGSERGLDRLPEPDQHGSLYNDDMILRIVGTATTSSTASNFTTSRRIRSGCEDPAADRPEEQAA